MAGSHWPARSEPDGSDRVRSDPPSGVFCGSNPGARPEYGGRARLAGCLQRASAWCMVDRGRFDVGRRRTVLDELGDIIGVIPKMLVEREVAQ